MSDPPACSQAKHLAPPLLEVEEPVERLGHQAPLVQLPRLPDHVPPLPPPREPLDTVVWRSRREEGGHCILEPGRRRVDIVVILPPRAEGHEVTLPRRDPQGDPLRRPVCRPVRKHKVSALKRGVGGEVQYG
eukprot:CAMPEP_0173427782 /NCGR_PEP_ID=MMETSP1357-20121228/6893_1 /TAXON_ID=77926 /ORGANISM="Hemiselmis rufescens, Strain PCC563" /LENGTH=131 /DNA_ID=CAMNT_0014391683 /DNA_START=236 /DNA_END=631 /DNA_ORIENTATION=+